LGEFQENSLLTGVNMSFDESLSRVDKDILRQDLSQIAPIITSIDSIECKGENLIEMLYNTNHRHNHESQLRLEKMMEKTRILVNNTLVDVLLSIFCMFN
jgi:hypothetical protein